MATSQVQIVNQALGFLKVGSITAMSESSEAARRATLYWDQTLDEVLSDCDWGFARVVQTLAQLSGETATGGGWDYLYAYPPNCVRIRKAYQETASTNPDEYEFEEMLSPTTATRALAANISPAYFRYTYRVTDPNQFDPKFIEALTLKLAAKMAGTLTGSEQLGSNLQNQYLIAISEAKRQNANEGNVSKPASAVSSYVSARS